MSNVSSSNSQVVRVPKLRFPGFEGEWESSLLGELGTFTKGAPLSKADISENGTPFILYGELYTTYGEVTKNIVRKTDKEVDSSQYSCIGDVIIPTSGETPEEIATATCVMVPNVILAGDLNIFRGAKVDGRIISYIVNHVVNRDISRIAQGKSVVHVKADELSKIQINYPNSDEQKKLISFLEVLSERIEKQRQFVEALKSYKRGAIEQYFLMQQDNMNWTKTTISNCLFYEQPQKYIVHSEHYSNTYKTPVLTANKAFILGYTNEQDGIYDKGDVLIYDDFTMEVKYVNFPFKVKSSTIKMLTPQSGIDLYFMFTLLQFLGLKPEGHQRSYISILEPMEINIPCYEEQTSASKIFRLLDNEIEKEQQLLRTILDLKAALLQQMFI